MNLRKIKLDLTVALLNNASGSNAQKIAKDRLKGYTEVGKFLQTRVVRKKRYDENFIERSYAIQFEHCTLNLDILSNRKDLYQVVNGFQLTNKLA
ncbi:MAG: hypothetical protein GYB31_10785 [Bacteroidetes bacterium]|nr:hypothetical protein [Bacteroidota bacterium]